MPDRTIQRLFLSCRSALEASPQPLKNRQAIAAITQCRTPDMGVTHYGCPEGHGQWEHSHSCRHRSCCLCADKRRLEWIEAQKQRLLDVPHFHVIFTLPHEYLPLWRYNEALFARLLFKASQESLQELLADKKYGAIHPGILMTLHTWGRQLNLHPHTHCLVTAGGIQSSGRWRELGEYLLPSAVLRRYYRGKVQALLREAALDQSLTWPPDMREQTFWQQHRSLYRKEWSVRIEERYSHGKGVMLYLARYCKGGPLRPEQIRGGDSKRLEVSYLDHRDKRIKYQQLTPWQLIQRLLLHVPAQGVHTVRYYGLYAPAAKRRYQQVLTCYGNLTKLNARNLVPPERVLLHCSTCGAHAMVVGRRWRRTAKGNSYIKKPARIGACGYVQQGVERDLERESPADSS
jgi:hypothetical protein